MSSGEHLGVFMRYAPSLLAPVIRVALDVGVGKVIAPARRPDDLEARPLTCKDIRCSLSRPRRCAVPSTGIKARSHAGRRAIPPTMADRRYAGAATAAVLYRLAEATERNGAFTPAQLVKLAQQIESEVEA